MKDESRFYKIYLKGYLDTRWANWFDGLTITSDEAGHTILSGVIQDQAELHGIFKKIYNLGLPLVSVNPLQPGNLNETGV